MNQIFDIPKEYTTVMKFAGKITLMDTILIFLIFTYGLKFSDMVYSPFRILALLYCFLISAFWLLPHSINKGERNWNYIVTLLMRNRQTYHSIEYQSYLENDEK